MSEITTESNEFESLIRPFETRNINPGIAEVLHEIG